MAPVVKDETRAASRTCFVYGQRQQGGSYVLLSFVWEEAVPLKLKFSGRADENDKT